MAGFDNVIANAAETLLGDEHLRSNLDDAEAKLVLDWAVSWLERQIGAARNEAEARQISTRELGRVRKALAVFNDLAKRQGSPDLASAVAAVAPLIPSGKAQTRAETFGLLAKFLEIAWNQDAVRSGGSSSGR